MSRKGKLIVIVLIGATALVSLTFLFWIAFNLKLISDDYCTAESVKAQGIIQFINFQFQNWTGAFIAAVANSILGSWAAATFNSFPYLLWVALCVVSASGSIFLLLLSTSAVLRPKSYFGLLAFSLIAFVGFVLGQFGIPSE